MSCRSGRIDRKAVKDFFEDEIAKEFSDYGQDRCDYCGKTITLGYIMPSIEKECGISLKCTDCLSLDEMLMTMEQEGIDITQFCKEA